MRIYKIIVALLLTSLLFFLLSGCSKNEETITKELSFERFNAINVKSFGNVSINYGATQKVIFKGDEKYLTSITNKVINGELFIQNNAIDFSGIKAEYIITIPSFNKLLIDGESSVVINDFEEVKNLTLDIKGDGDIKIHELKNIQNINIFSSGNAQIEMLANTKNLQNLNINASGIFDFKGYLLQTQKSNVDFSGSGSIKIWVKELLKAKISGTGTLFYKGYPTIKTDMSTVLSSEIIDQN